MAESSKLRWWQHLIPTYGNWGGPGWSGGVFVDFPNKPDYTVAPVDEMDALFKEHDEAYQSGVLPAVADAKLLGKLKTVPVKGIWSNSYRIGAMLGFSVTQFIPRAPITQRK